MRGVRQHKKAVFRFAKTTCQPKSSHRGWLEFKEDLFLIFKANWLLAVALSFVFARKQDGPKHPTMCS